MLFRRGRAGLKALVRKQASSIAYLGARGAGVASARLARVTRRCRRPKAAGLRACLFVGDSLLCLMLALASGRLSLAVTRRLRAFLGARLSGSLPFSKKPRARHTSRFTVTPCVLLCRGARPLPLASIRPCHWGFASGRAVGFDGCASRRAGALKAVSGRSCALLGSLLSLGRAAVQPSAAGDPKPPGWSVAFVIGDSLHYLPLPLGFGPPELGRYTPPVGS